MTTQEQIDKLYRHIAAIATHPKYQTAHSRTDLDLGDAGIPTDPEHDLRVWNDGTVRRNLQLRTAIDRIDQLCNLII